MTATIQAFVSSYVQRHELVESELLVDPMSKRQAARQEAEEAEEALASEADGDDAPDSDRAREVRRGLDTRYSPPND